MSPTSLPPEACAAARAVLETPLSEVIRVVTGLPSPKKQTPAQARFVGGTRGKPQHVVTLNHDDTLSDSLEKLARHRILGAPVLIQPDPLHADEMHHDVHYDDSVGRERPVLLGFFDVGDALRALVKALPQDDDRDEGERIPVKDVYDGEAIVMTMMVGQYSHNSPDSAERYYCDHCQCCYAP